MSETSGVPEHRVAARAEIEVQKDGPYWVTGIAPPTGLQGIGMTDRKYVLCRCGLSGNKPTATVPTAMRGGATTYKPEMRVAAP